MAEVVAMSGVYNAMEPRLPTDQHSEVLSHTTCWLGSD